MSLFSLYIENVTVKFDFDNSLHAAPCACISKYIKFKAFKLIKMQQAHRPGTLKQSNKAHKSRHRSKRGISAAVKG